MTALAETARALDLRDPVSGRPLRVLITRPDEQAEETAELVRAAGGEPLLFPCLHRAPPPNPQAFLEALSQPGGYAVVAVSSANAALSLGAGLAKTGDLVGTLFAAIGPRTARALASQGIYAEVVAGEASQEGQESTAEGLAAAIAQALASRGLTLAGARVLFPRAVQARAALVEALTSAGAQVIEAVAYDMIAATPAELGPMAALLRAGAVDLAPFGSPRTASIALSALAADAAAARLLERTVVGAIGPTTAAALRSSAVRVDVVAQSATFSALLAAMAECWQTSRNRSAIDLSKGP